MTTVFEVDRQVKTDDAVAARLWPKLGPKVRTAYLHDRDGWIAIRRDVEAGKQPSDATLEAQHKAFAGWAHAFRAASRPRKRPTQSAVALAAASMAPAPVALPAPPPAATVKKAASGGAGGAVAGGLVLAGLIAVAARRKRA